jgi:hypothetical protein
MHADRLAEVGHAIICGEFRFRGHDLGIGATVFSDHVLPRSPRCRCGASRRNRFRGLLQPCGPIHDRRDRRHDPRSPRVTSLSSQSSCDRGGSSAVAMRMPAGAIPQTSNLWQAASYQFPVAIATFQRGDVWMCRSASTAPATGRAVEHARRMAAMQRARIDARSTSVGMRRQCVVQRCSSTAESSSVLGEPRADVCRT